MSQYKLNLDEQCHFPPFKDANNHTFDLSHLNAVSIEYIHAAPVDKPELSEKKYRFYITYSMHCFAKDYPELTSANRQALMYCANKESRPFCYKRYELSKQLPAVIENLPNEFTFHGGHNAYATCSLKNHLDIEVEYYIAFSAYRENKKLRIHVMSAYPLDDVLGKRKPVNFFSVARNLLANKKLPRP